MSSKSKRNRQIQQNRAVPSSTAAPAGTANIASTAIRPEKPVPVYNRNLKEDTLIQSQTYFLSELKWIGLVTAVIIILLIIAYYVIPH
jgi:hypothetical protein